MYQVGTYKNNSWALVSEFAKSGVIFDFDDSSAQAEAAKSNITPDFANSLTNAHELFLYVPT